MFLMKAMRYYRLWIYTCNAVLFLSVLVFCCAATYILTDSRRQLVTSVRLYHPSFLYAYVALLLQGGVIQVVGCVAALRLSERLLNAYWISLLVLLVGDILIGGIWMIRFDHLTSGLTPELHGRLRTEYTDKGSDFRRIFDSLQSGSECCGVGSPVDYNNTWWQWVETDYFLDYERAAFNHTGGDEDVIDVVEKKNISVRRLQEEEEEEEEELDSDDLLLPWTCCVPRVLEEQAEKERKASEPSALANTIRGRLLAKSQDDNKEKKDPTKDHPRVRLYNIRKKVGKVYNLEEPIWETGKWCTYSPSKAAQWHHHQGCAEPLKRWVNTSGDALFVIGFCVIAFLKCTFLGILRYEIKEMIQKIKMMQNETQQMNGDLAAALGLGGCSSAASSAASTPSKSSSQQHAGQHMTKLPHNATIPAPVANDVKKAEAACPLLVDTTPAAVAGCHDGHNQLPPAGQLMTAANNSSSVLTPVCPKGHNIRDTCLEAHELTDRQLQQQQRASQLDCHVVMCSDSGASRTTTNNSSYFTTGSRQTAI